MGSGTLTNVGRVVVVSGGSGSPMLFDVQGAQAGQRLGSRAVGVGDVNADGFDDVLAVDATDTVRAYSGMGGSPIYAKSPPATGIAFGASLAGLGDVDGDGHDDFAVGAPLDQSSRGSVFVYSGKTTTLPTHYVGNASGTEFGRCVAAAGDWNGDGAPDVLVGAPRDYSNFGKVYVYPSLCLDPVAYCATKLNSTGAHASIGWAGGTSIATNHLALSASQCPPNNVGLFYYGTTALQLPFGDGFKCVGGTQFRFKPLHVDASGNAVQAVDFAIPPQAGGQITAGSTWFFQFWYRDPGGPLGSNFDLTNALKADCCP